MSRRDEGWALSGKIALVTGGARGMGAAHCAALAAAGASVVVCDVLDTESACLLYTSPSPRDVEESRMPSSA